MKAIPKPELHTAPTADSTFLTAVKLFLKVDHTSDDALIAALIVAATQRLEKECDRKFLTQKWNIYFDNFGRTYKNDMWWDGEKDIAICELYSPCNVLDLPFGPCSAITAFKTYDNDDTATTFAASNYQIDTSGPRGRVGLRAGAVWPSTILRPFNGIKLEECTFGYGSAYANTPEDLQHAVKLTVAKLYENRGDQQSSEVFTIPNTALVLLGPYMPVRL